MSGVQGRVSGYGVRCGPKLFKNLGNGKFGAIPLDKAAFGRDAKVMQVAFADLDNDGKPDIYLTTYRGGNFVMLNEGRDFEDHRVLSLPKTNHVATMSTAFADIDGNGTLDIYQGNWSFGNMGRDKIPYATSRNDLFLNHQLRFERVALENNVGGETLSSLFSDINGDGRPDLLVANDFDSPDQLYLGQQKGGLVPLMARNPLIPVTPFFNMSYDTADINSDLSLDIFASDMDLMGEENTFDNLPYCERIDDAQFRKFCQESFFIQEASETVKATDCSKLETARSRSVCIASVLTEMAFRSSAESYCQEIPQGYATSRELCFAMVEMKKRPSRGRVEKKGHVFQVMRNVLLVAEKGGAFQEAAAEMGVLSSSWSWNSKFADLDNDEWQDIYVGNGFQRDTRTLVSNMFFHNQQRKKFARQERDFGLEDHVIIPSYT